MIDKVLLSVDMDALINIQAKKTVNKVMKESNKNGREALCQAAIDTLAYYRKEVARSTSRSHFLLPEAMKIYPILILGLMKTPALRYLEEVRLDNKVASMYSLLHCSFSSLLTHVYPKVYSISQIEQNNWGTFILDDEGKETEVVYKAENIPASVERMVNSDAYIISSNDCIYIYVPKEVAVNLIRELFAVSSFEELTTIKPEPHLIECESTLNIKVHNIIDCLRKEKGGAFQQVRIILVDSELEHKVITDLLVEDCKNPKRDFSYIQFLNHIHRLVINKSNSF